jgi:hypothetical protein
MVNILEVAVMLQVVGYTICTLCAIGAVAGFVAVAWQLGQIAAQRVQETNVAAYVPNTPLPAHGVRKN